MFTYNVEKYIIFTDVMRKFYTNATDDQISAPIKIWLAHAKENREKQARA